MDKHNPDWITGGYLYKNLFVKKTHGKLFEEFIINEIIDRYDLMCSIDEHGKQIHRNITMEAAAVVIQYHSI